MALLWKNWPATLGSHAGTSCGHNSSTKPIFFVLVFIEIMALLAIVHGTEVAQQTAQVHRRNLGNFRNGVCVTGIITDPARPIDLGWPAAVASGVVSNFAFQWLQHSSEVRSLRRITQKNLSTCQAHVASFSETAGLVFLTMCRINVTARYVTSFCSPTHMQ